MKNRSNGNQDKAIEIMDTKRLLIIKQKKSKKPSSAFNPKEIEQLYTIFSSLQPSSQNPSSSLALIRNFWEPSNQPPNLKLSGLLTLKHIIKWWTPTTNFPHVQIVLVILNLKLQMVHFHQSLEKGILQISDSITLEYVLHVPNLSCNLLSIS